MLPTGADGDSKILIGKFNLLQRQRRKIELHNQFDREECDT